MSLKDTIKKNKFVIGGILGVILLILIAVVAFLLLGGSDDDEGVDDDDNKVKVCSAGEFSKRGKCVECAAGTYSESNATECITCDAGRYSAAGSDKCSICGVGTYSKIGSETCDTCSAGTYATAGSAECTKCTGGQVSGEGADRCEWSCDDGKIPNYETGECLRCPVGTYSKDNMSECEACPSAEYAPAGSSQCYACDPGLIVNEDQSACRNCPPGRYLDAANGYCAPCPEGSYSDGGGGCTYCSEGEAGVWGKNGGRATEEEACSLCPANYYVEGPFGPFDPDSKKRLCALCTYLPGVSYSRSEPGSDPQGCGMCLSGNYFTEDGSSCEPCPANTYASAGVSKGSGICLDNPLPDNPEDCVNIESYDDDGVSSACTPCPADYISTPGSGVCKSIFCEIKDDSDAFWTEYKLVTQTGQFLDKLKEVGDVYAGYYDFSDIDAIACDEEFLKHVENDKLQMIPYTETERKVFESFTKEKLKVYNFISLVMSIVLEDGPGKEVLDEWINDDIKNLDGDFTLNKEFPITPTGNLCTDANLDRLISDLRWGQGRTPFWSAQSLGNDCKRLNNVDFESVYKRLAWYSAFVPGSKLWDKIYSYLLRPILEDIASASDDDREGMLAQLKERFGDGILPEGLQLQDSQSTIPPILDPNDENNEYYMFVVLLSGGLKNPFGREWGLDEEDSLLDFNTGMAKMWYNMYTLKQIAKNCKGASCTVDGDSSFCTYEVSDWGAELTGELAPGC